jgi:hypothetical protein
MHRAGGALCGGRDGWALTATAAGATCAQLTRPAQLTPPQASPGTALLTVLQAMGWVPWLSATALKVVLFLPCYWLAVGVGGRHGYPFTRSPDQNTPLLKVVLGVFFVCGGTVWMLCYSLCITHLHSDELKTEATRLLNLGTQARTTDHPAPPRPPRYACLLSLRA